MKIVIREYCPADWDSIQRIHDAGRRVEFKLAGLEDAFLPLSVAAEREDLFDYPGIFVAEGDKGVVGFAACTAEELAWLYVDPVHFREGVGRKLTEFALRQFPKIQSIEALVGNEPARTLYESFGFKVSKTVRGKMPGNEDFAVEVYLLERKDP